MFSTVSYIFFDFFFFSWYWSQIWGISKEASLKLSMSSLNNFILTRRLDLYTADLLHKNSDFCPITCKNFRRFSTPVTYFPEFNQLMRSPEEEELSESFGWHKRLTICIAIPIPCRYNQAICCKITFDKSYHFLKFPQNFVCGTNFGGNSKYWLHLTIPSHNAETCLTNKFMHFH